MPACSHTGQNNPIAELTTPLWLLPGGFCTTGDSGGMSLSLHTSLLSDSPALPSLCPPGHAASQGLGDGGVSVPQPCAPSLLQQDLTSLLLLLCLPTLCRPRGCLLADCAGFLGTKEVLYPLSSCSLPALTGSPVSGGQGGPWWWLLRLRGGSLCVAGLEPAAGADTPLSVTVEIKEPPRLTPALCVSSQSHVVVMFVVPAVMGWAVGAVPCLSPCQGWFLQWWG